MVSVMREWIRKSTCKGDGDENAKESEEMHGSRHWSLEH